MPSVLGSVTPTVGTSGSPHGYNNATFTDIDDGTNAYSLTVNVTVGSVVLLIANVPSGDAGSDNSAQFRFARGGTAIGPVFTHFWTDQWTAAEEVTGSVIAFIDTHGTSGSVTYTVQAKDVNTDCIADWRRAGGFAAIEILSDEYVTLSDTGNVTTDDNYPTGGFSDITSMTRTIAPGSGNIVLCVYSGAYDISGGPIGDTSINQRFAVGGTPDGVLTKGGQDDPTEGGMGAMLWAFTGDGSSTTYSVQANQIAGSTVQTGPDVRRFQVLELESASTIVGTVQSTTASTASTGSFAQIDDLTITGNVGNTDGVALILGGAQAALAIAGGANEGAESRLTAGGGAVGAAGMVTSWVDEADEFFNGQIAWAEATVAASRTWTMEWKTALGLAAVDNDGTAPHTLQVVNIQPAPAPTFSDDPPLFVDFDPIYPPPEAIAYQTKGALHGRLSR